MRYSSIRFVLDQFCTQRFTTSAPLLYLIVASKGLYSQGHYIIAGSNGIVSYFIGIVRSGQDILIVMLGLLCLHMLGKIFRLIMVIGYLIGIVPKSLHIALSGVSLVFGSWVAIGHT